ncbi:MAG: hypothetical protein VKO39_13165 [Cyanobacteriota bacterium]|nr:hypothetical protein [Cyanobacteriota bacterium]
MAQLTIKISDKADALIAQLQKEIFNRRRKKVTAEGVVETLIESGAKSQSDKRFATSWQNLIADIERAAMVAQAHGSKPSSLSDEEWALVLSHRTRSATMPESKRAIKPRAATRATKAESTSPVRRRGKGSAEKGATAAAEAVDSGSATASKTRGTRDTAKATKPTRTTKTTASTTVTSTASAPPRKRSTGAVASASPAKAKTEPKAKAAPKTTSRKTLTSTSRSSVARRMAKAASRLANTPITAISAAQPGPPAPPVNGGNGVDSGMSTPPAL